MSLLGQAKSFLTDTAIWRSYRRRQLQEDYLKRARYYSQFRRENAPKACSIGELVQQRLSERGWAPRPRGMGHIHTFAVIPTIGWHSTLIDTLGELGKVTCFSFDGERCYWRHHRLRNWSRIREETNREILLKIRSAHTEDPVDWVFFYTEGLHLLKNTVRGIREDYGLPCVMMCLDDKQSWEGVKLGDQRTGQVDLVPEFDVYWTSARTCCDWILAEGGRPIYMPEGCDPVRFRPMDSGRDIRVSFVGGAYGFRRDLIRFLKRWHVPVEVFGPRWGKRVKSVWGEDLVRVFNRSEINLGHGGIGYSEELTNVKTRDFEVPATGGGMYLTTYSSDLGQHYDIGGEIACYHGREELVDLIHYYLQRPAVREEMARRGRERCVREHRWTHRYLNILQMLGIVDKAAVPPPMTERRVE